MACLINSAFDVKPCFFFLSTFSISCISSSGIFTPRYAMLWFYKYLSYNAYVIPMVHGCHKAFIIYAILLHMPYSPKEKRKTNRMLDKIAKKEKLKVKHVDIKDMAFKKITVTLPEPTVKKLEKLAKKDNRSKSNMIRHLIDKC